MGTVSHKLKSGEMVKLTAPGIGPIFVTAGIDEGGGNGRFFKLVTHLPDEVTLHRNPKNAIDAKRWPGGAPVNMQRMTKDGIAQRERAKENRDAIQSEESERRQALISGTLAEYNHAIKHDDLKGYRQALQNGTMEAYRKKIADLKEPEPESGGGDAKTGVDEKTPATSDPKAGAAKPGQSANTGKGADEKQGAGSAKPSASSK